MDGGDDRTSNGHFSRHGSPRLTAATNEELEILNLQLLRQQVGGNRSSQPLPANTED